jgi:hypothetical protein
MPNAARVSRIGHLPQAFQQAGTLARQQHAVTGGQVTKLLQGSSDRDDDRAGTVFQQ